MNRFKQIDRQMMTGKPYLYVNAVRGCVRFRICLMRNEGQFFATTQVGNRVHKSHGRKPSDALEQMFRQIRWALASGRKVAA